MKAVIGDRMKKQGPMRWSRASADALLEVCLAELSGLELRYLKRWYLPSQRMLDLPRLAAA